MIKLKTPNSMEIAGQPAVITYVPELNAFRGKFLGLSGYCDFVSDSIQGLQKEGELSLREYLEDCKAAGIEPYARTEKIKTFTLRYPESLSERNAGFPLIVKSFSIILMTVSSYEKAKKNLWSQ
ncbi:type II toxin-antitoxin system HicB family antitoxin [Escherichia coli]|nr:type II toxin-antitoxin system HicB family antitoxin [Escherichia coli]MCY0058640.1 type II toxin-antitoxin system HicB family antitoxin [Escherichia coli]